MNRKKYLGIGYFNVHSLALRQIIAASKNVPFAPLCANNNCGFVNIKPKAIEVIVKQAMQIRPENFYLSVIFIKK